jgi:hypothetical protein
MRILLDPPKPNAPSFEIDHQIAVALATLHGSFVKTRGAGRFGSRSASILLERDEDGDTALAVLDRIGIHATLRADPRRVGSAFTRKLSQSHKE